ncbi:MULTISPECIES: Ger(x)C family spore germination protein [Rossellomorea]|jgi:spore germination protein KC|uniref:Ger(x)C family spore germination protein n=1 Tax=Rossellomorea TaxID=2837508 RepID=UPI0011E91CF5|nr:MULTISPECIES: Ger(x)C family spore germination protein [Rossellomorea]MDT9024451.1 Ger(x)C family spore germination protein [Rossellomorea sp. YC4-1]TYS91733.1 Ger(x)C family spore germination protein [Rossellomorea aquimaris]
MRKKYIIGLVLLFINLSLAGCWDQRLLKNGRLVFSSSFDMVDEDTIKATAIIRDFKDRTPTNVMVQGEGKTIRETRMSMDRKISGVFEPSKNRVFLLGEELAKKDIYKFLDIFYRDPNSSISAKLAVVEGSGEEILSKLNEKNVLISEFLIEILTSAEGSTGIPKQNLQTVCTIMFDEGKDFALPLIKMKDGEVELDGTAIFHKNSLTGTLSFEESTLYLLMDNQRAKRTRFVTKIDNDKKMNIDNYITYNVAKSKSKLTIVSDTPDNIQVGIDTNMDVSIAEYPQDKLTDKNKLKYLNKEISKQLTEDAQKMIEKIQIANSDLFGIGRELIAYHPKTWEKINWTETYPTITIVPTIKVDIVGHGIIN